MKTYKGFNADMTCKGFQYEEGKEYETDKVEICQTGFHACEYPLDCFNYYNPCSSIYHEVKQDGEIQTHEDDTKIASTKIKIGARLDIAGLVKAAIDFTMSRIKPEVKSDEDCGASSATGDCGASSATGDYGASSATGYYGASSATGYYGASSATGDYGASSATGYYGASSATGYKGASSATGSCGASSATGYKGTSESKHPEAIAVAWGYYGKAKGVLGSYLVLAEWKEKEILDRRKWILKTAKMERVDGERIKADTWYTLIDGEFTEVKD